MLLMLKVATLTKSLSVLERSFSRYGTAIPSDGRSHSSSGAEQRYTTRDVYCVFIEMCLEPCLKIRLPVCQIAENSFRVVNLHQLFGQRVVPHTLAQDRRAEYYAAIS